MKEFTRAGFTKVRTVVDKHLAAAGKELGITLSIGNISFDANQFSTKLKGLTGTDSNDHAKKEWDKYCRRFGFKSEHFGVTYGQYTIVGIASRSRKYPILATVKGKNGTYKVSSHRFFDLKGVDKDLINPIY